MDHLTNIKRRSENHSLYMQNYTSTSIDQHGYVTEISELEYVLESH